MAEHHADRISCLFDLAVAAKAGSYSDEFNAVNAGVIVDNEYYLGQWCALQLTVSGAWLSKCVSYGQPRRPVPRSPTGCYGQHRMPVSLALQLAVMAQHLQACCTPNTG